LSPALVTLLVIVFIDMLGFGMVIPVMTLYAERLGAPIGQTGWLMASYSLMQFVFAPLWGRLSDRWGRRPLLLFSIAMTSVAFLVYALAPSFGWLVASRLFAGAATGNIGIAMAYVADVTRPEDRARGMGFIGAAFGMGFVLGPWMGGELSQAFGLSAPGFAAAALAAPAAQQEIPVEGLSLEDNERNLLARALEKTNGNQTQAARLLRITRDTLRYKMKKFNLR